MQTSLSFRRYLVQQLAGAIVVNATVTALLTWWLTRDGAVPVWGEKGLVAETVLGALGVTLLTVFLASPIVRHEARQGKVAALPWTADSHAFLRCASHRTWGRALLFALATTLFITVPVILAWSLVGPDEVSYTTFFAYKVLFVVAVGCIVTPLNILWVLTDRRTKGAAAHLAAA